MNEIKMGRPGRWRWYHAAAFYAGVQGLSFGLGLLAKRSRGGSSPKLGESIVGNAANDAFYNRLVQPIFAPPDWVFAPVWTLNNLLCLWGLLRVLNMLAGRPERGTFLWLQGSVWLSFVAFNGLYFGLRSPINGALSTNIGFAATVASMYVALFRLRDGRAALSQSTILPWLVLATATANTVAAWNRDECYEVGPFITPPPGWSKGAYASGAVTPTILLIPYCGGAGRSESPLQRCGAACESARSPSARPAAAARSAHTNGQRLSEAVGCARIAAHMNR